MAEILTKACCFVMIVILGWVLRRIGFFKAEDFQLLSKIVLRITLPAAIVYSYAGRQIDPSMLLLSLLGCGFGLIYVVIGFLMERKNGKEQQAFAMMNLSGYNIGNFTMPFAQSFLGSVGVIPTILFDTGNAVVCLGLSYSFASMVQNGEGFSIKKILRALSRSVPFVTYVVMTGLTLMHISLPGAITEFAGILSGANAPMAMLMLGVGFHISGDISQIFCIVKILSVRYVLAAVAALGCFFLLPMDLQIRQALAIACFSPITSAAPAFTGDLGGDAGLASALNSISIVVSLVCIVGILLIIL